MFLTELYHGSPPESELNRLNGLVQEYVNNGRIPWVSTSFIIRNIVFFLRQELNSPTSHSHQKIIQSALRKVFLSIQQQALQQEANKAPPSQRQLFTSNHDYRDAVRRHTSKGASEAKSTRSLTTNQAYGWKRGNESYNDGPPHKIRGKKSCPETLYCNELIKSGFTY